MSDIVTFALVVIIFLVALASLVSIFAVAANFDWVIAEHNDRVDKKRDYLLRKEEQKVKLHRELSTSTLAQQRPRLEILLESIEEAIGELDEVIAQESHARKPVTNDMETSAREQGDNSADGVRDAASEQGESMKDAFWTPDDIATIRWKLGQAKFDVEFLINNRDAKKLRFSEQELQSLKDPIHLTIVDAKNRVRKWNREHTE